MLLEKEQPDVKAQFDGEPREQRKHLESRRLCAMTKVDVVEQFQRGCILVGWFHDGEIVLC